MMHRLRNGFVLLLYVLSMQVGTLHAFEGEETCGECEENSPVLRAVCEETGCRLPDHHHHDDDHHHATSCRICSSSHDLISFAVSEPVLPEALSLPVAAPLPIVSSTPHLLPTASRAPPSPR